VKVRERFVMTEKGAILESLRDAVSKGEERVRSRNNFYLPNL